MIVLCMFNCCCFLISNPVFIFTFKLLKIVKNVVFCKSFQKKWIFSIFFSKIAYRNEFNQKSVCWKYTHHKKCVLIIPSKCLRLMSIMSIYKAFNYKTQQSSQTQLMKCTCSTCSHHSNMLDTIHFVLVKQFKAMNLPTKYYQVSFAFLNRR